MPAKTKPDPRDLTQQQNDALRVLFERIPSPPKSQAELAKLLGVSQSTISSFLSGRQGFSWPTAINLCALAGADVFEVLKLKRPRGTKPLLVRDMPAAEFLLRCYEQPGLVEWIKGNLGVVSVGELIRAFEALRSHADFPRREDGQPYGGWGKFFADLKDNKFDPAPRRDDADVLRTADAKETRKA